MHVSVRLASFLPNHQPQCKAPTAMQSTMPWDESIFGYDDPEGEDALLQFEEASLQAAELPRGVRLPLAARNGDLPLSASRPEPPPHRVCWRVTSGSASSWRQARRSVSLWRRRTVS